MAKRKKRKKRRSYDEEFMPTISRGIIAIILVIVAAIIALSFFGKAGSFGEILDGWLFSILFGVMRYALPILIAIIAWYVMRDEDYDYRTTHGIGAFLFFIAMSGLFHIGIEPDLMWSEALEGHGGGIFGMLAWVLKTYLGTIAGVIILIGLTAVSLMLLFNTSLVAFIMLHKTLFAGFGWIGNKIRQNTERMFVKHTAEDDEEDEYDDEDEEEDLELEEEDERTFSKRTLGEEEEGEEDDDEEEEEGEDEDYEEEEEGDAEEETSPIPLQPAQKGSTMEAEEPAWLQNVVVRPLPKTKLLKTTKSKPTSGDIKSNSHVIKSTLKEFRIDVDMGEIRVGPTVTQFTLKPAKGVKLSRITALSNDLALALAAHPIRIEAPIPGKSLVGIEVPNQKTAMVTFKELVESKEFKKRPHDVMLALGKDVGGKAWQADLLRMPHLLIAGSTGSGKTVCVNTLITSLLFQNTAETLRFIMIDPKRVELTMYNGIPHLITPVITNTQKTVNALKWAIGEMDRRFEMLARVGNRDIKSYNTAHPDNKLPYIVIVIDELADLMATAGNEVEASIIRLAQMARAVGIHLIVATQRPSVDVITGLMKANIPGRIAFSVASVTDSRTILDGPGAEKLIGRGDMLLQTAELSKPVRIQGAFISEEELKAVVKYLKGGKKVVYDESVTAKPGKGTMNMFGGPSDDQDPVFDEAKQAILEAGKASASFLQRRLKVGYARAARILDELEEAGIVGPANGSKPREILMTKDQIHDTLAEESVSRTSEDAGAEFNVFNDQEDEEEEEYDEPEEEEEEDEYVDEDEDEDEEDGEYEDEEEDEDDEELEEDEECEDEEDGEYEEEEEEDDDEDEDDDNE